MAQGEVKMFLRGNKYWVRYFLRGEQIRIPTGKSDPIEAEKFRAKKQRQLACDIEGKAKMPVPQSNRIKITDLLADLKSEFELNGKLDSQTASKIRQADEAFGNILAVQLDTDAIKAYKEKQKADGYALATINRPLQYLRLALKLAVENKKLSTIPTIKLFSETDNIRKGFVSPTQFESILEHIPKDLKDYVEWSYETGMRKSETAQLAWEMIPELGDVILIPGSITKNGKARKLPLVCGLAEIIERRRDAASVDSKGITMINAKLTGLIFTRANGKPVRNFLKSWNAATEAANLPEIIFHDLRRSCVRNLIQAGVTREHARLITGHASDSCFTRYNIVLDEDAGPALEQKALYQNDYRAKMAQKKAAQKVGGSR